MHIRLAAALVLASVLASGCNLLDRFRENGGSPTSPSGTGAAGLQAFAGTWRSAGSTAPATGCGGLTYTVTPVNTSTANVTFAGTCAGSIQVNGTGTGTLRGAALEWSAQGLVVQGNVNCPFSFTNGRAEQDSAGIRVTYGGTVCGIPVSGSEVVARP
jgi:hypothetical protein